MPHNPEGSYGTDNSTVKQQYEINGRMVDADSEEAKEWQEKQEEMANGAAAGSGSRSDNLWSGDEDEDGSDEDVEVNVGDGTVSDHVTSMVDNEDDMNSYEFAKVAAKAHTGIAKPAVSHGTPTATPGNTEGIAEVSNSSTMAGRVKQAVEMQEAAAPDAMEEELGGGRSEHGEAEKGDDGDEGDEYHDDDDDDNNNSDISGLISVDPESSKPPDPKTRFRLRPVPGHESLHNGIRGDDGETIGDNTMKLAKTLDQVVGGKRKERKWEENGVGVDNMFGTGAHEKQKRKKVEEIRDSEGVGKKKAET